jgi:hypothetical protein
MNAKIIPTMLFATASLLSASAGAAFATPANGQQNNQANRATHSAQYSNANTSGWRPGTSYVGGEG